MPPDFVTNVTTTTLEPVLAVKEPFGFEDVALPIETEATTRHTVGAAATASTRAISTTLTTESTEHDNTVAIALVVTILVVMVLFTVIYVLFQKRRQICNRGKRPQAKADMSANEVLITPAKANGGVESSPQKPQPLLQSLPKFQPQSSSGGGLVSGPRESRSRQAMPRKWFDSAAIKYMDQSTDTLDRV